MRDERPHLLLGVLAGTGEAMRLVAREGAPVAEVEVDLVYGVGDVLPLAQHRRLHAHAVGRLELVGLPVDLDLLGVSVHQPFELAQHGVHRGGELEGVGEGTGERLQRVRAEQLQAVLEAAPLAQGVAQVLPHVVPHVLRGRGVVAVARALHALLRRAHRDLEGGGAIVEYVDDPPLGEQVADLPSGPRRRAVGSGTSPEEVAARPLVLKVPVVELVLHDVRLRADLGVGVGAAPSRPPLCLKFSWNRAAATFVSNWASLSRALVMEMRPMRACSGSGSWCSMTCIVGSTAGSLVSETPQAPTRCRPARIVCSGSWPHPRPVLCSPMGTDSSCASVRRRGVADLRRARRLPFGATLAAGCVAGSAGAARPIVAIILPASR